MALMVSRQSREVSNAMAENVKNDDISSVFSAEFGPYKASRIVDERGSSDRHECWRT